MQRYLFRRVGLALLALFALSILTFALVRSEHYVLHYNYDPHGWDNYENPSLVAQYGLYMQDLFQGNWDKAWGLNQTVWSYDRGWGYSPGNIVLERIPTTLRLAAVALAISGVLGVTLGVLAASNKGSPCDRWISRAVLFGQSMPIFWLGVALIGITAYLPGRLPVTSGSEFTHMILPAITLGLLPAAVITQLIRSAMLAALESDYVKLARIKGLTEWNIIWKHCLRNVVVSPLLSFGLIGGSFMTALVLTEAIFQWPGAGLLTLQTIGVGDYHPMLSGVVLCLAGGFILCHLIYDVVRAFLDPRIRFSAGTSLRVDAGVGY